MGKAESFGSKFASVATGVAKAAAVGLGAAATAFGTLGTMSVKSFADYEQLTGGVETLFKGSADAVNEYAESAYKTAGMSANQYMETITSFSASLLQGLGGDTAKAAEIGNLAVTDMSDNANKMGTGIEMIQNAYQGFAKDNFTMLDNLKLGFGGTAGEMARLVNESGVLGDSFVATAENVKNIPFDQLVLAIHTVQTEMGITGTTALEASETIAGSWNALTSSWGNVLTSLASGNKDFLSNSIDGLVSSASDFAGNVMESVTNVINNITEALPGIFTAFEPMMPLLFETLLPAMADGAVKLVTGLAQGVVDNLPLILDAGGRIIQTLIEGVFGESEQLNNALNGISNAFNNVMTAISESGLIQNIVDLLSKIGEKALEITPFILEIFSASVVTLIERISSAVGFLTENFDTILAALIPLTAAFVGIKATLAIQGIITTVSTAITALSAGFTAAGGAVGVLKIALAALGGPVGIIIGVVSALAAGIIYLWNTNDDFKNALIDAWEKIVAFIVPVLEEIKETFISIWNGIVDFFTPTVESIKDLVETIFGGIKDFFSKNGNEIKEIFTDIWNKVKEVFKGAVNFIKPLFETWLEGMKIAWKTVWNVIRENFETVIKTIKGVFEGVFKTMQGVWDVFAGTFKGDWERAWNGVKGIFEGVWKSITSIFGGAIELGGNLIKGIWQGINDAGAWLRDKISGFFGGVVDNIKNFFGIRSPSKLFAYFGKMNMEGFAQGIEGMERRVSKAADSVFGDLGGDIEYSTSLGAGGGIRNIGEAGITPSAISQSAGQSIYHVTVNVKADDMDSAAKVVRVFEDFSHNNIVFGGV